MLDFHLARHEQHQQLQEYRRLLLHNLVDRGSTATTKGEVHLADRVGIERMTRTMDVAAKVRASSVLLSGPGYLLDELALYRS